jgi:hypothetical protein
MRSLISPLIGMRCCRKQIGYRRSLTDHAPLQARNRQQVRDKRGGQRERINGAGCFAHAVIRSNDTIMASGVAAAAHRHPLGTQSFCRRAGSSCFPGFIEVIECPSSQIFQVRPVPFASLPCCPCSSAGLNRSNHESRRTSRKMPGRATGVAAFPPVPPSLVSFASLRLCVRFPRGPCAPLAAPRPAAASAAGGPPENIFGKVEIPR